MRIYLKRNADIKKIIFLSLLAVQAIILTAIETQLPFPAGVPGIKLGLVNIITIVSLIFFSFSETLIIVTIRCIISLFLSGPVMFMFSICGGVLSVAIMWLMLKYLKSLFSLVGISITGSITHNVVQIMVACFILSDMSVAAYLPVSLVSGLIIGCFNGVCSTFMVKALKKLSLIENI